MILLLVSVVLDCVDGDMARARLAQNPAGARLDVMGDYLVHLAVFAGLATGLWREGLPRGGVWAALALIAGVGAAMAAVHVLFIRPALRQGGDLHWAGDARSLRGRPGAVVAEKLASRDYTYLLLVLAAIGHLEWFLYAAAGGAWVFTAALIAYRFLAMPQAPPGGGIPVIGLRRRGIELACLGSRCGRPGRHPLGHRGRDPRPGPPHPGVGSRGHPAGREPERRPEHRRLGAGLPARRADGQRLAAVRRPPGRRRRQLPHARRPRSEGSSSECGCWAPHVPSSLRWASVSVAKIGQSLAQAVFILLGLALVLPGAGRGARVARVAGRDRRRLRGRRGRHRAWVAFVWAVDRGFWTTAQGALRRVRLGWLLPASWAGPGRDLDATLARLGPWRAAASLGCFVAGWAVGAAEIYLILRWVGGAVDWQTALALETGSVLIDGILFFVPAKVGTQEGGKVVLFAALGLNPARGLTVGVVRRIRELTYAGLGLVALGWLSARPDAAARSTAGRPASAGRAQSRRV